MSAFNAGVTRRKDQSGPAARAGTTSAHDWPFRQHLEEVNSTT